MASRLFSVLALSASLLAVPGVADAQEWEVHRFPEDGFQAEFSGPVEIRREDRSVETKGAVLGVARFAQNLPSGGYAVFVTTFAKPDPRWEEGARGVFAAIGCGAIVIDRTVEVGGVRMLELSGAACLKGTRGASARFAQVGNRIYQAMAIAQPVGPEGANAQRFVRSFSIIKGKE